jgi:thioredoxin-related protein
VIRQLSSLFLAGVCSLPALRAETSVNLLETDWHEARQQAEAGGRHLYVAFLGEGWSMASDRFQATILQSPEWKAFAGDHLVYCPVLARRKPKLSKDETARLQALVIHFDVKAYPTLILLAPDGNEILRHGYREDSAGDYVALLEAILPPRPSPPASD